MVNLGARGHGKYGLAVFSKRKVHYLLLHYKPSQNLVSDLKQQPLVSSQFCGVAVWARIS